MSWNGEIKMTTYARIINNTAVDVVTTNPATLFYPTIAAQFVIVPDGTVHGSVDSGGVWTAPAAPHIAAPALHPILTPMAFYLAFTPAERIAIKKSTDPDVMEFWATYQLAVQLNHTIDPNLVSVQQGLAWLATPTSATPPGPGILASTARIAQISDGIPQ